MIWAFVFKAMLGLGIALPIQKKASAGAAPSPPTGPYLQADFSDQAQYEGWAFW